MKVVVIDYGLGNLHSVAKALVHEGADVILSSSPDEVARADRLILPGVGAFADGMAGLGQRGMIDAIARFVARERPLLGICLGMQLLFSESHEFGQHRGLDLIPGKVLPIPPTPGIKVPQIGWNRIVPAPSCDSWQDTILGDVDIGAMVYFVHSFTAHPTDETHRLADADYGGNRISAAVQRGSVIGCQFHPEKSGLVGLRVIRRFVD